MVQNGTKGYLKRRKCTFCPLFSLLKETFSAILVALRYICV